MKQLLITLSFLILQNLSFGQETLNFKSPKRVYKLELNNKELPNQPVEYGDYYIQLKQFEPDKSLGIVLIVEKGHGYFQFNINKLVEKKNNEGLTIYAFSAVENAKSNPITILMGFTSDGNMYYFAIVTEEIDSKKNIRTTIEEYQNIVKL